MKLKPAKIKRKPVAESDLQKAKTKQDKLIAMSKMALMKLGELYVATDHKDDMRLTQNVRIGDKAYAVQCVLFVSEIKIEAAGQ